MKAAQEFKAQRIFEIMEAAKADAEPELVALFEEYEKRGGNGYVHSTIEPVMRELREID